MYSSIHQDRKYYQFFRGLLNNEEASPRSYLITTLILRLKSTNYYALMLRSKYFFSQEQGLEAIEREVYFANCLLSLNAKEYQLWTYKKQLFKRYSGVVNQGLMLYHSEGEFVDYLLDQDCKNYHVWDYKLWLTQFFKQE
jgi:protein farnesyltransferase/geranylgeranyltransferase type-1 subunit alpha